ncbi:MAG: hypothetical protein ACOX19_12385 [Fermentimonas sp.]|jgi:hypothetical protein
MIITQDYNIQRKKIQRKLVEEYDLGMVYIRPPSKTGFQYWELVKLIVKHWEQIIEIALKEQKPFSYRITARGGRPEKI